ncbi:transcription initiation factor IIB family protein [Haloarchaeobius sp. HME9146]|uniref:transcription initiation factor IIB n=1 Tax=Haloarchaeobius sp. HME9146 TaxID=2978732 RepID=UPI0021C05628|nr:transcription initiation factor IIB family protein [Haloarchaeobius sp. HME9146]MCT9094670.1 transcription initiation factor IIB family protein [Haloarchaeobius sp. HME9146]
MSKATQCCPECSGALERDRDETVCDQCGLVVGADRIDRGPEWRSFSDGDASGKRTGAPLTRSRHDRGLSTEIGYGNTDTRLTGRKRRTLTRLRRQHNRARIATKTDRNKVYGFTEIRRIVGSLSLPRSIREQACTLFESAQNEDLLRGRSIEGFASAAVYATCRVRSISRTVDEVVDESRADEAELQAAYDAMNRDLGLPTGPIDPREYLARFATELELPNSVERRARELAGDAMDDGLASGRNPSGFAAGCLYAAARDTNANLTQAAAAEVADVSTVTVRSAFYTVTESE